MDTREESLRLLKEAEEDLGRAVRYSGLKDWITTIHYAQMATEKSAKALISCFESFEWTHDPSGQIRKLVRKRLLNDDFLKIASHVKEAAPWHGRSTYGGVKKGVWRSPSEFCTEEEATNLLHKAKESVNRAIEFIENFWGSGTDEYQKD